MQLTAHQQQMLDGNFGPAYAWAMKFLVDTGTVLGADRLIPIRYAFFMADTDAMGEAGIHFMEELAQAAPEQRIPAANLYLESRHTARELLDFGLPQWFMDLDQRRLDAIAKLGCIMEYGHINNHSIPAPCFGESIAMGSTPTAIYANSALGARTNFEAGPAALASALAGYVPRWDLHLDENRVPKRVFEVERTPQNLAEWGALGAAIGLRLNNANEIPLIKGLDEHPGALALNHIGASLASYAAVGLFHVEGATPEAHLFTESDLPTERLTGTELDAVLSIEKLDAQSLDLVVLGAPQMGWSEVVELTQLLDGKKVATNTTLLAFVDNGSIETARTLGLADKLEAAGCHLLDGIDYFQSGSEPIRQANGWTNTLTASPKLGNILNGAGYNAAATTLAVCIQSAIAGRVVA
ncbi:DUF521 domain-containing protein [Pontibacterium sp. N1Y112]|uniref:DUF521 domain-containing protein n=1 Tax=Pontibacterium sinense TaxID=2781979 RepID=A0A8J7FRZ2_9GAMM|nr:aconitase X [Pontibacterium sinense]MBE9398937.1 DUF521 domain-containing protein [Pontibacterium sinense]